MADIAAPARYPVQLDVDYPQRQARWKALLRLPLSVPVLVFSWLLQGGVTLAMWTAILVSGRIPRWLFEFQVAVNRWQVRAGAYFLILTDDYPPFEGDYAIRYDAKYPERPSRWRLVIWKFISSIPHLIILSILSLTLLVVMPISWFAILFTGRYPQTLHRYVSGILRWEARVHAYILSLTDEFPPFSLSAVAASASPRSYVMSSGIGVVAIGGVTALFVTLAILVPGDVTVEVSYERLLAGELAPGETLVEVEGTEDGFWEEQGTGTVELTAAADPADALAPLLVPRTGYRFVEFELAVENQSYHSLDIEESNFRLKDDDDDNHRAVLVVVDGHIPPLEFDEGESFAASLFFELPVGLDPTELNFNMVHHVHRHVVYKFQ